MQGGYELQRVKARHGKKKMPQGVLNVCGQIRHFPPWVLYCGGLQFLAVVVLALDSYVVEVNAAATYTMGAASALAVVASV